MVSEAAADNAIFDFLDQYPGVSGLHFIHGHKQEDFYGPENSAEAIGEIKGAFLPKDRQVHLPLANLRDLRDLRTSLQHEALGHYGTLTFTTKEKQDLLEAISESRLSESMWSEWDHIDSNYDGQSEDRKAEEVFCRAAERVNGPQKLSRDEASKLFSEVVTHKTRLLERDDIDAIAEAVADGLHRGTRVQQIFPKDNRSQFRGPGNQADSLAEATDHAKAQLGPSTKVFPAQTMEGAYKGPIIAETEHHYLQQVSATNTVTHGKVAFGRPVAVDRAASLVVAYDDGTALVKPAKSLVTMHAKSLDRER